MVSRTPAIAALCALILVVVPRFGLARTQADSGFVTSLTASPTTVPPGFAVAFAYTGQASPDTPSDTSITSATIDYGDGQNFYGGSAGPGQSVAGTASHVYSSAGTYTAIFKAEGSDGEIGTSSTVVMVSSQLTPPTVSMHVDNASVQVGDTITVTYTVTPGSLGDGSIAAMGISYGDGETDLLTSPSGTLTHSYSSTGSFPILIVATDSSGQTAASSAAVQAGSP